MEEQLINETAECKIIGVTLETRPDKINYAEVRRFRKLGCTRVQLGVQHTDPEILEKVNRGHKVSHAEKAIKLLKTAGFKVDIHLMPDLPGSDVQKDWEMFRRFEGGGGRLGDSGQNRDRSLLALGGEMSVNLNLVVAKCAW